MLRSLMSGVAGLKAYQTKMDVIGNNIANVNTVGFKSSSVNFSDIFYQTTQSASSASNTRAGTNAKQIGYGSSVAGIATTTATQGGSQTTNRALDLMINGNAFFIVQMDGQNYFTKNGSFDIDGLGNLANESGGLVMGWGIDQETGQIVQDAVSPIKVYSPENQTANPDATTDVYFQGNIDSKDPSLEEGKIIQMDFYDNLGNQYAAKFKVKSENAEDDNEYKVELVDVIDANEQSIFLESYVSNGITTYSPKEDVEIEFGGYTYRLTDVDKMTGEVTLTSYVKDAEGIETPTEGDVVIPAAISYSPDFNPGTKEYDNTLYRLNGNKFEIIPEEEIHLYAVVDSYGELSVNSSIDQSKHCAFFKADNGDMIPITEGLEAIDTTMELHDFNESSNEIPCYYDMDTKTFKTIPKADWETMIDTATGDLQDSKLTYSVEYKDAGGAVIKTYDSAIYFKDGADNFRKVIANGSTDEWETGFTDPGVKTIISGIAEKTEQQQVNKGADILFNASTGKFASVSGSASRYDENGNMITNNVIFKVYTSDSRLETSAKDLFEEITVDFSSLSMFADGGTSTVSGVRGNLETGLGAGWATGVLTGVSVGSDGRIYGEYDNGVKKLLGQIAVTSFANPTGLEAVGNS